MKSEQNRVSISLARFRRTSAYVTFLGLAFVFSCYPQTTPDPRQQKRQEDVVIRVRTQLVTIPVNVVDKHGSFVADLKREQFRVYEDGADQEVAQ